MTELQKNDWASAIARRISDEWSTGDQSEEDVELLNHVIYKALLKSPKEMKKLIGTLIIEDDYFEHLH